MLFEIMGNLAWMMLKKKKRNFIIIIIIIIIIINLFLQSVKHIQWGSQAAAGDT